MKFSVLGPAAAVVDGRRIKLGPPKQRDVFASLSSRIGVVTLIPEIVDDLWPSGPPPSAVNAIQNHVAGLRRTLGAQSIETSAHGYRLCLPDEGIDFLDFEQLAHRGVAARNRGDPATAAALLREALGLWTGRAYGGLAPIGSSLAAVALRLDELRVHVAEEAIEAELALGRDADLVPEVQSLVAEHPFRERLSAQLMHALYCQGRQVDALRVYDALRERLVDELGIDPSPAITELHRRILLQDPDLSRLHQQGQTGLLRGETPRAGTAGPVHPGPPRSEAPALRDAATVFNNLPVQLTPFFGRATELPDLADTALRNRLTTVVGPGGMGKTRLALEVAAEIHGRLGLDVWFVALATLASGEQIDEVIRDSLGVRAGSDASARTLVIGAFASRRGLIVLDNCEQVVDAVRLFAEDLLRCCPAMHVLATSREPLHAHGEHAWMIPPMDPDGEAIELFVERASATRSDFALTAQDRAVARDICARLDGMPLAIEMAASRVRSMTVVEIAARLDQRFGLLRGSHGAVEPRHETLEATLDWSFELCDEAEKALLTALSVFAGTFDLAGAHAVAGGEGDELVTLDLLSSLIDRSLLGSVRLGDRMRFVLLETIRQYASRRLTNVERRRLGRRHMEHYASAWRGKRAELFVSDSGTSDEKDNLAAAVQCAIAVDDAGSALAVVASMTWLVMYHVWVEGESWALAALSLSGAETYVDAMWTHAMLAYARNNMADAAGTVQHATSALRIEAQLGLPPHPQARRALTVGATWLGDLPVARSAGEEYLALARAKGAPADVVMALYLLIQIDVFADRDADPVQVCECLRMAEDTMLPTLRGAAYQAAGVAFTRTDPSTAVDMFERCDAVAAAAGIKAVYVGILPAFIVLARGATPIVELRGLADSLDRFRGLGISFGARRVARDFALTFMKLGRPETVALIAGASSPVGHRPRAFAHAVATSRSQLGSERYGRSFDRGRAMTDDQLEEFIDAELVRHSVRDR